jgi:methylmalonyl-CoA mutase
MSAPTDPLELAAEFPAASEDEWRALVAGVLRKSGLADDADPIEALSSTTYDGIRIQPLYPPSSADRGFPGSQPFVRGGTSDGATTAGWDVRAHYRDPDPRRTNTAALADLESGATSLWLTVGDAGLAVADLPAALEGVYVDLAPIALDAGAQTRAAATAFLDLVNLRDLDEAEITGSLGADPIGLRARTGDDVDAALLAELAGAARPYPNLRIATVDGTVYHDAGASDADEIAIATAVGVAYLRELTDAGLTVDEALTAIEFRLAVTADQFLSIAKLRAARQLWGRIAELSGAADGTRGQYQHAVTSAAMMTRRDPWVNMLRTTIGCFAAAVGGADAITVLPFDTALGLPDAFARRIARNTQAVLHDESSLGRVIDAAGGSGYVEALTAQLAENAWDEFTAIERDGGALAALDGGRIGDLLARTRDERDDDIAHRRFAITGVTEYALPEEAPLPRTAAPPALSGGPLPAIRYAEPFEALRDRAEAADPRPAVFLAALGPIAAHSARVGFATNLFNAGGLRVVVGAPEDFADSGTTVACLCSSDKVYAAEAADAAAALRAAGARQVWLAGQVDVDGVDGQVFAGCDALAVLTTTLETLAVPA